MTITARKLRDRTVIIPGGHLNYVMWADQREEVTLTIDCTQQNHCTNCGCTPVHVVTLSHDAAYRIVSLLTELTPPAEWV